MSVCTFIASDHPLTEAAPVRDYPTKINIDTGTIDDGGADDNYFLYLFEDVRDYTDKKYGVYLEWDYTEGRAKQLIAYMKNALQDTASIELWHVWLMDYYEWEDRPVIHKQTICIDELTAKHIREMDEAEIWNTPDKMYPDRPSFYCLEIKNHDSGRRHFSIDAENLYWIDGSADDPEDLCLHGLAMACIGGERLEYDCTVSATALYLLKTLTEDHIIHEDIQMLPCCGHFYVPDNALENVYISGCGNGIDWTVKHNGRNVILISESGTETTVSLEEYRQEVYRFADKIERYYQSCSPKILPDDPFTRDGYTAFWNEWHRRRNA